MDWFQRTCYTKFDFDRSTLRRPQAHRCTGVVFVREGQILPGLLFTDREQQASSSLFNWVAGKYYLPAIILFEIVEVKRTFLFYSREILSYSDQLLKCDIIISSFPVRVFIVRKSGVPTSSKGSLYHLEAALLVVRWHEWANIIRMLILPWFSLTEIARYYATLWIQSWEKEVGTINWLHVVQLPLLGVYNGLSFVTWRPPKFCFWVNMFFRLRPWLISTIGGFHVFQFFFII